MQTSSRPAIPVGWRLGRASRVPLPAGSLTATVAILLTAAALAVAVNLGSAGVRATGAAYDDSGSEGVIAEAAVASPAGLAFEQPVGARAPVKNVEVTNLGTEPLHLEKVAIVDPSQSGTGFVVNAGSCAAGIPALGTCTLGIEFRPQTIGLHNATLKITPTGSAPMSVALMAAATD
ncbi:MAG TPA: choice-of-anchor D domain-containing protein [Actinomycetota bacterium]|nr:choice-of-anchor D domain-containing protein [Actinomycetota bacterium]